MHFVKSQKIHCLLISERARLLPWLKEKLKSGFPEIQIDCQIDSIHQALKLLHSGKIPDMLILDKDKNFSKVEIQQLKVLAQEAGVVFVELPATAIHFEQTFNPTPPRRHHNYGNAWRALIIKGLRAVYEKRTYIIPGAGKVGALSFDDILYVRAEGAYSRFVLKDYREFLIPRNLGFFDCRLPKCRFVRIHNSYFVNINCVLMLKTSKPYAIILKDAKTPLPVAQRRLKALKSIFKK